MNQTSEQYYGNLKTADTKLGRMSLVVQKIDPSTDYIKWSWSCLSLKNSNTEYNIQNATDTNNIDAPRAGDVALFRIKKISNHTSLVLHDNKKMRLYKNDLFVGVFGNRYAADAFEGRVQGFDKLGMLTAAGMVGTVRYRNKNIKRSTKVAFEGYLCDNEGKVINLKERLFHKKENNLIKNDYVRNLILVVGSGMNSGKTTVACKMINQLTAKNLNVAGCKLTGSISHRDKFDMLSAGACTAIDFSDYGFPSTYLCKEDELMDLCNTMISDIKDQCDPDVIVMEIADGILQRETSFLLKNENIQKITNGLILAAADALSALYSVEQLKKYNYRILAVSGAITSSPLSCKEFQKKEKNTPLASSLPDSADEIGEIISTSILS